MKITETEHTHQISAQSHEIETLKDSLNQRKVISRDQEAKVNQLYQQIADLNTSHCDKLTLGKTQFDEASSTILAQAKRIEELQYENDRVKELNHQIEYTTMA